METLEIKIKIEEFKWKNSNFYIGETWEIPLEPRAQS